VALEEALGVLGTAFRPAVEIGVILGEFRTFREKVTEQENKFEYIDSQMVNGMTSADKQCRKLNMGGMQWIPQYTNTNEKMHALRRQIKEAR
jgi:hypothetical protein